MMKFKKRYLKDVVYGSIDGIITTFAVVSGVVGASLSYGVIVVLGLANLLADGISMAVGNYLSTKSEIERINQKRKEFHDMVRKNPSFEKEKLIEIFKDKGFSDEVIKHLVEEITLNKEGWEKLMLSEYYGNYQKINPKNTAFATFVAFVVAGSIPLLAFIFAYAFEFFKEYALPLAIVLTGFSLFMVGTLKASITKKHPIRSGIETLLVGGIAALVAFFVGYFLKGLAS